MLSLARIKNNKLIKTLYWKHIYRPAILQLDLSKLDSVSGSYYGYNIIELCMDSPLFDKYLSFINVAYEEKIYNKDGLKKLLLHHYWMKDVKTFVLINDSNQIVASISAGIYKNDEKWGGIFKFATDISMRKKGIGLYMLRYGYASLKSRGVQFGESVVSVRKSRISSLMTHFKCGFKPQYDRKQVRYFLVNRNGGIKHLLTNYWLKKYYNLYIKNHSNHIIK